MVMIMVSLVAVRIAERVSCLQIGICVSSGAGKFRALRSRCRRAIGISGTEVRSPPQVLLIANQGFGEVTE